MTNKFRSRNSPVWGAIRAIPLSPAPYSHSRPEVNNRECPQMALWGTRSFWKRKL